MYRCAFVTSKLENMNCPPIGNMTAAQLMDLELTRYSAARIVHNQKSWHITHPQWTRPV